METSSICNIRSFGLFVTFILLSAFLLLESPSAWPQLPSGSNTTSSASPLNMSGCYTNKEAQPQNRMTMSSVALPLSKVISVSLDNQMYICNTSSDNLVRVDVSTYSILTDDMKSQSPVERSVEVITCVETMDGTLLECASERPPGLPIPVSMCSSKELYPPNPTTFNTVLGPFDNSSILKTIHADLDIFPCRSEDEQLLKSVLTFTGIFYNTRDNILEKRAVETMTCVTNIADLRVLTCNFKKVM